MVRPCLTGQGEAAVVHHRDAEHYRFGLHEVLLHCENDGLTVLRVKDRLDHQQVDSAVYETTHRLRIGLNQLVPSRVAEGQVLHAGRQAQGAARGSDTVVPLKVEGVCLTNV